MIRHDIFSDGQLVERIEIERLDASTVEYRRFDGDLNVVEQRPATAEEIERVDAVIALEDLDQKRTNVEQAVDTLRSWAEDARSTNVTNGNNNTVTQVVVDRLGVFFDRFADLIESR